MKIYHIAQGMPEFDRAAVDLGHTIRRLYWPDERRLEARAIRELQDFRPDLVFIQAQQPGIVSRSLCEELRKVAYVVNWTGDVRDTIPPHYVELAPFVNVTAFTNMPDVEAMQAIGHDARFLQIGYDPDIYNTLGEGIRDGVVFVGNDYGNRFPLSQHRRNMVNALKKEFPHAFTAYGRGFGTVLKNGADADVYRSALVAINLDHYDRPGFFSDRYLRSMACGCYTINGTAMGKTDLIMAVHKALKERDEMISLGSLQARETYQIDRWHNRINTIEEWMNG